MFTTSKQSFAPSPRRRKKSNTRSSLDISIYSSANAIFFVFNNLTCYFVEVIFYHDRKLVYRPLVTSYCIVC